MNKQIDYINFQYPFNSYSNGFRYNNSADFSANVLPSTLLLLLLLSVL